MNREHVKAVEARLWRIDEVLRTFNRPSDEPLRTIFLQSREATVTKLEILRGRERARLEVQPRSAFVDAANPPEDPAGAVKRVA